jgi:membrane protease YdiL (CAAX protease family)
MEEIQDTAVIDGATDNRIFVLQKRQYNTIIIAGIAIAVLFDAVVGTLVLTKSIDPPLRLFLSRLLMWGTLPLLYLYAVKVEDRPFLLWTEKARNVWFYIAAIAVLFFLTYCGVMISAIPRLLGFHDNYTIMKHWNEQLKHDKPMIVFVCLTAGFTEELLIRGYVLPRLCLLFRSAYMPIIISSLIFSLLHLGY